jgi:hypothetical protein
MPTHAEHEDVPETRTMRVEISEDEARRLRAYCALRGESVQHRIGELIRAWLAEQEQKR